MLEQPEFYAVTIVMFEGSRQCGFAAAKHNLLEQKKHEQIARANERILLEQTSVLVTARARVESFARVSSAD